MTDVTVILAAIENGNAASEDLLPLVYDQLRRIAAGQMRHERPGQTLQATALVHEAYLRLLDNQPASWENRRHFFAAAAIAMQRILVEQARRKHRLKHGGQHHRVDLPDLDVIADAVSDDVELLALDEALLLLQDEDPRKAELVRLRYFAGLSEVEAAQTLGISRATASRWWTYAKAWLYDKIRAQ